MHAAARALRLSARPAPCQFVRLFTSWREELSTCRKFAPAARNYTAAELMPEVGLRVNECCKLDAPAAGHHCRIWGRLGT